MPKMLSDRDLEAIYARTAQMMREMRRKPTRPAIRAAERKQRASTGTFRTAAEVIDDPEFNAVMDRFKTMAVEAPNGGPQSRADKFLNDYPDQFYRVDEVDYRHAHPESLFLAKARAMRIPKEYHHCRFENWIHVTATHQQACNQAREWAELQSIEQNVKHLIIHGNTGTGKTHLAIAAAKVFMTDDPSGASPRFHYWRGMLEDLRDRELLVDYMEPRLMIFDDVGETESQKYVVERFQRILIDRIENHNPTIITSNLAWPDEFLTEKIVDDRIISRLRRIGRSINLKVEDYRKGGN